MYTFTSLIMLTFLDIHNSSLYAQLNKDTLMLTLTPQVKLGFKLFFGASDVNKNLVNDRVAVTTHYALNPAR